MFHCKHRVVSAIAAACSCVAITLNADESSRSPESLRAALSKDVKSIAAPSRALPGTVLASGVGAIPIAYGRVRAVDASIAVASTSGMGSVVAVSHGAFFESDMTGDSQNIAFLRDCMSWLARGAAPKKVFFDRDSKNLKKAVECAFPGVEVVFVGGYAQLAGLPADSVLVTSPDGHPIAEAKLLDAFVRRGGGVFAHVVGWGWHQITRGKSFATESPFNAALGGCGVFTSGLCVEGAKDGRYPVSPAGGVPGTTAEDALRIIESQKGPIARDVSSRAVLVLGEFMSALPSDDVRWMPRIKSLANCANSGKIPTPKHPLGPSDALERIGLILHQKAWLANPERVWPAHPAAATYPGLPEAGTPRVTRKLDVDMSVPRWHGTGLFAVAGEPIALTLQDGAEKFGLRVRVGTTHCDITKHDSWSRAPQVTVEIPLNKKTTTFSSPFGGLVYVIVPDGRKGATQVEIGPACPAAWFVDGRDTNATWAEALKTCPAPMAEIESDVIALTFSRSDALKASDPQGVLDIWRRVLANDARLTGIPEKRSSPERMCGDVQLCCGYMHSGYPIMLPDHSIVHLLSPQTLLKGDVDEVWGFFHEMGHNHQNRDWTFNGSVEVTVNFFSLYNMELICGKKPRETHKMKGESLRRRVEKWKANGRSFDEWKRDPFLALYFFMELQEKYGWDAFIKMFAEYRSIPQSERPKTDADKRRQWSERFSRVVGEDLSKEFQFMQE